MEHLSQSDDPHFISNNGAARLPLQESSNNQNNQTAQRYSDNAPKEESTLSILQGESSIDKVESTVHGRSVKTGSYVEGHGMSPSVQHRRNQPISKQQTTLDQVPEMRDGKFMELNPYVTSASKGADETNFTTLEGAVNGTLQNKDVKLKKGKGKKVSQDLNS